MVFSIKRPIHYAVDIGRRLHRRIQTSKLSIQHRWSTGHLTGALMNRAYKKDGNYRAYIFSQIRESYHKAAKVQHGQPAAERTVYLVRLLNRVLPVSREQRTVLCVGCRDAREMDHIEATCRAKAVGIDLFSVDPRIVVGDMHQMPFEENQFDCLYSCHSLEHAYDIKAALKEFVRVTRPGGVLAIEAPIFEDGKVGVNDLSDVGSAERLVERLGDAVDRVLIQEEDEEKTAVPTADPLKVARVLVRIKK